MIQDYNSSDDYLIKYGQSYSKYILYSVLSYVCYCIVGRFKLKNSNCIALLNT